MPIFIVEAKKVTANRCSNDGVAACYWNDTLVYCAPQDGPFTRSVAVEAEDIDAAIAIGTEKLKERAA